jgi:asparagine synthase (glutamine-hydrolysing)
MASRDGRWRVTYNGEIYNHLDLRRELEVNWRGHSDTETLVESLAAHGMAAAVARLNGMFAFAAVDLEAGKLYLARDPFGNKPVYYRVMPARGPVFASEIRALQGADEPSLGIDPDALQSFLTLRFVPSPDTLWQGVHRLPPGHLLEVDLQTMAHRLTCYIEPVIERFQGSIEDAVETYHDLLGQGIERQLLSDVPVGLLLSSGIDSALVAALAKEKGHDLPCYTVGFEAGHEEDGRDHIPRRDHLHTLRDAQFLAHLHRPRTYIRPILLIAIAHELAPAAPAPAGRAAVEHPHRM